ncbi:GNAT family N-acetyltransferase [Legionella hackeliae]|uniref:DNA topology modulation protein n=1 Tax=Legionella hackeliae TaxID=449 RepID=A0A0A8UP78_LEGHA|nr:GNAT family N-acetyltransferase [Legionella hackeliae]KTD13847.1 GNAT family acetyltransferase [Legionella hackeliae]CEK10548.1 DNA topology modulation protein [Legionella hackeliae]STX47287.1 DNA topology modulation protein [Legionella hackeliae]
MILFKQLSNSDIPTLHGWLQLPHVREFWDDGHRKQRQVKQYYLKYDGVLRFMVMIGGEPVGYIQRYSIDKKHPFWKYTQSYPSAGIDLFIGNTQFLGKGWAVKILASFIKHYCSTAAEIIVDPEKTNHKAIRSYSRLGFQNLAEFTVNKKKYQIMAMESQVQAPKRIMIIGKPGSGKSTFAVSLKRKLALPLFHLDKFFFEANWVERKSNEFLSIQEEIVNQNSWIIDGNSIKSLELRYSKTDICLYFNFPRRLCYWRLLKRFVKPNSILDDRAPGCKNTIRWALLKYLWSYEDKVSGQLLELRERYSHVNFIEIRSSRDLAALEKYVLMLGSVDN